MDIIGRTEEKAILQTIIADSKSSFIAIYGRRRVGKTYLIREFFKKNIVFECAGLLDGDKTQQLESFYMTLSEHISKEPLPSTWLKAFALLKTYINGLKTNTKKVIFLDEIPWFDTPKSGFLPALNNFWNQYCNKRNDIILVICGSAATWIIDKVIYNKGGLHNRVDQTILLQPFDIKESKQYLKSKKVTLTDKDLALLYMIVGGVPFYLNQVKPGKGIPHILDDLFFNTNATLKNEFDKLYAALFKNHETHIAVIQALASKISGMTRDEIIKKSKLSSGGGFTNTLNELVKCGFILSSSPLDKIRVDTIYRLVDEYSFFYLKFLKTSAKMTGTTLTSSQKFKIWSGYAFENFCFRHQNNIAKVLGISGIIYNTYSWLVKGSRKNDGSQIDLLFDRADNCINLFEIKFSESPFKINKTYAAVLLKKKEIFISSTGVKKNIFITMISSAGCEKNEYYFSSITNEITLSQIIEV